MNDRIKELADKASQWVIDNSNGVHAPYERWNEKFAELIVRECSNYVNSRIPGNIEVSATVAKMKKHFGVEE